MAKFFNQISSIKVLTYLASAMVAGFIFSGCNTPTVNEYGNIYKALTKREEAQLIVLARATLKHNVKKGVIAASESEYASAHPPNFRIRYQGNRFGEARVAWQLPTRRIMVVFNGNFFTPTMQCTLQIANRQPEMLDYSNPHRKPQLMDFYQKNKKSSGDKNGRK